MRRVLVLVALLLVLAGWGWGNGVYIPQRVALKMPEIPVQRALITYRDGVETLVVASGVQTDSPEVGWILPVPAEPTELRTADADMLTVLELNLGPKVWHDQLEMKGGWPGPMLLFWAMLPLAVALCVSRDPVRSAGAVGIAICWMLLLVTVLPSLTNAGLSVSVRGVNVTQEARLGQYSVSVLEAADAQALNGWLESQSLAALDERAAEVVDAYARERWRLVVARLAVDAEELAAPEPLVVKFATERCVFPMRLTALADSRTRVELFVASDQQAAAKGFRVIAADAYRPVVREGLDYKPFAAGQNGCDIVSPDAVEFLWPGCVVTHLQAEMEPAAMAEDVAIAFGQLLPTREQVYTSRYREELRSNVLWWGMVGMLVPVSCVFYARRRPGWMGGGVLLALAGGIGVVVLLVSQMQVVETEEHRYYASAWLSWQRSAGEFARLAKGKEASALGLLRRAGFEQTNRVTGRALEERRTPGNVALREIDGRTYFCAYDADGAEYRALMGGAEAE